jgi:hypothetical protein
VTVNDLSSIHCIQTADGPILEWVPEDNHLLDQREYDAEGEEENTVNGEEDHLDEAE